MIALDLRAYIITALLAAILALNTFYNSAIRRAPGSIYNTITFLLALAILLIYGRFHPSLVVAFALPVIFLMLSLTINGSGIRFGLASAAGFALLTFAPMQLNLPFLRRMIVAYLIVVLSLSTYLTVTGSTLSRLVANSNFNVNPNSASLLFFWGIMLTLIFARGKLRALLTIGFSLLIITTGSRAGFLVGTSLLVGYMLFSKDIAWRSLVIRRYSKKRLAWLILVITVVATLAVALVPASVDNLSLGLAKVWSILSGASDTSRLVIWRTAFDASQETLQSILFGYGTTTTIELIGGSHNSYVAAFLTVGWFFLVTMLMALIVLFRYHIRHTQTTFLVYAIPILLYGGLESVLFNGLNNIWYIFILLSLYYRSATGTVRGRAGAASRRMNT